MIRQIIRNTVGRAVSKRGGYNLYRDHSKLSTVTLNALLPNSNRCSYNASTALLQRRNASTNIPANQPILFPLLLESLSTERLTEEESWQLLLNYFKTTNSSNRGKFTIVLDDDPTGCQTSYNINVILDSSVDTIKQQISKLANTNTSTYYDSNLLFILTNTRALPEDKAVQVTKDVLGNINQAIKQLQLNINDFTFISRGDSTLRGHFAAETSTIQSYLHNLDQEQPVPKVILLPAFFEGGRITAMDTHYYIDSSSETCIPVGLTPFAKDPHFGFSASNLKEYIKEKVSQYDVDRSWKESDIDTISIGSIRSYPIEKTVKSIAKKLELSSAEYIIVNATNQTDMNIFTAALLEAERCSNARFVVRSAASFVTSMGFFPKRPLLTKDVLFPTLTSETITTTTDTKRYGGLIVVGSYVPKTSTQLQHLIDNTKVQQFELDFHQLFTNSNINSNYINDLAKTISNHLLQGQDVLLSTPRQLLTNQQTSTTSLFDTAAVSDSICQIVRSIVNTSSSSSFPHFVIAKGGITSHDIALKALQCTSATVLGQILPGVPVWKQDQSGSKEMPYIVFPGNVGDDNALTRVAIELGVPSKLSQSVSTDSLDATFTVSSTHVQPHSINSVESASDIDASAVDSTNYNMKSALQAARDDGHALAAFNIYNLEGGKAVVQAAEALQSPIIIQVHGSSLTYGQEPLLQLLSAFKYYAQVPVYLQLDHCSDEIVISQAVNMFNTNYLTTATSGGSNSLFDCIMIDGSHLPYADNLRWTSKMSKEVHQASILVEAELGKLAGQEDGLRVDLRDMKMTDPRKVAEFTRETECDLLAVTIGNVHGKYSSPNPRLDFPRLFNIQRALLFADLSPYLVLHGASGLPRATIQRVIREGNIVKFNVNTDLRSAVIDYYRQQLLGTHSSCNSSSTNSGISSLATNDNNEMVTLGESILGYNEIHINTDNASENQKEVELLDLMKGSTKVMRTIAEEKIRMFRP